MSETAFETQKKLNLIANIFCRFLPRTLGGFSNPKNAGSYYCVINMVNIVRVRRRRRRGTSQYGVGAGGGNT